MSDPSKNWHRDFDELVGHHLEGELSAEESETLRGLLNSQPGARRRFAEHVQLVTHLEDEILLRHKDAAGLAEGQVGLSRTRRATPYFIAGSAVVVATALLLNFFSKDLEEQSADRSSEVQSETTLDEGVAVITKVADAQWPSGERLEVGATISRGPLTLISGHVQFEFYHGAVVVVEGPAKLEFVDADSVMCRQGRIRAHVPLQSQGFTVLSPHFQVIDRGTEFGVNVAEDGSGAVHVFKGKVELCDEDSTHAAVPIELVAESGIAISSTGEMESITPNSDSFVSAAEIERLSAREKEHRWMLWKDFSAALRDDPRVLAYYSFERATDSSRTLLSHRKDDRSLDGAIVGCTWTTGRWPAKGALEFKRPSDRVRIHIPGTHTAVTYTAWVRIDGLDRMFNGLLLTNGYDPGEAHWQLKRDGRLILGVCHAYRKGRNYRSEPILDVRSLGQWLHLAVVYDSSDGTVTHFANGAVVAKGDIGKNRRVALTIGDAEIGNWGEPPEYIPPKIRNLNGRIDELVVFGEALSENEIQEFYEIGRP